MAADNASEVSELSGKLDSIQAVLDVDAMRKEADELRVKATDPALWEDQDNAQAVTRRLSFLDAEMARLETLGQRLDDPNSLTLIQPLVGNAIQRAGLAAMAAAAPDADTAQAIQDRLNALNQERAGIRALVADQPIETWLPDAPPEEANAYFDRRRLFGEQRALQWLATRR